MANSKISMIPYGKQYLDQTDITAVQKTLKSDYLTQGPKIAEFETALARISGATHATAVSSGTAALHLAYLAAGLKKGDEVITTPNTFVATTNMLLTVGAKPVFCDIRLDTYNIDETKIEKLITKKTKAIVPVHFAGQPVNLTIINKLAKKYNLLVIEDACHALGATHKNKSIGSLSDMTVFSFHPVKAITTGEGGAVVTNNPKYHASLQSLRSHGIHKDEQGKNVMTDLGYNYRLTDIQAALGLSQLKKLGTFIKQRRQVVKWYQQAFKNINGIVWPQESKDVGSAWHLYVILVKEARLRDPLVAYLKSKGIGVNFHYPAVYSHPYYRHHGYAKIKLSNMDYYHRRAITLPLYTKLTKKEIGFISDSLREGLRLVT